MGRHWQLNPSVALEASTTDPICSALDEVFSAFASKEVTGHTHRVSTELRDDGRLEVLLEGARVGTVEPDALAPFMEGSGLGLAMRRMEERLVLHAAGLEIAGVGIALIGEKGSGKSTLALLAAVAGHRFFGDELLPIAASGDRAFAFPKSATIKEGVFHLFADKAEHQDPLRGAVRYVLPPSHAAPDTPLPLRALVFPRFMREAEEAELMPLVAEEVALPLVQQTFGGLERVEGSVECIARLCRLPRYFLPYADAMSAVAALEALAAELQA